MTSPRLSRMLHQYEFHKKEYKVILVSGHKEKSENIFSDFHKYIISCQEGDIKCFLEII